MYFFYYIPIGLDVAVRKRPFVTYFIATACVILYIIYRYMPIGSWWDLSLLVFQPSAPTISTAITHAFLHGGWLHLIGNLVYLIVFGRPLEDRLGSFRFYVVFTAAAAVGAYTHLVLTALYSPQYLPYGVIGASGATSGILGAYLVRLYFSRVRVAYWVFMPFQGVNRAGRTYVPVIFAILFWFALQGIRTFMQLGTGGMRVAYSVHLGGFGAGVFLALCFGALAQARSERHLAAARRRFEAADWFGAQAEYVDYLAIEPCDANAYAELARAYLAGGDRVRARSAYAEAVRVSAEKGERDAAEGYFDEAARHVPDFALPEPLHIDIACGMERTLKYRSAMGAYERFVWNYPLSKDAPFVLLRMAVILEKRLEKPAEALACYARLAGEYASDQWAEYAQGEIMRLRRAESPISACGKK
jgi:membrane associated rhomboid family serine protease